MNWTRVNKNIFPAMIRKNDRLIARREPAITLSITKLYREEILMRYITIIATLTAAAIPGLLYAQTYPAKTVRVVVPWPPGGLVDTAGRIVFQKISENTGQQFVLDNRAGATGVIGADIVAKSAPDGYTLMVHSASHISNPHTIKKLPYDTFRDFTPIGLLAAQTGLVTVHPSLPVKTTKELLALAKAQPGQILYASSGTGSFSHLAVALIDSMAGTKMLHVPYKGGGPATTAIVSGETHLIAGTPAALVTHMNSNRLRLIAVTSETRLPQFPQTPTIAESGVPGYEFRGWISVIGPANLPRAIVDRISSEINRSMDSPDTKKRMETLEPWTMTPEQTAARFRADYEKYGRLIKLVGIDPQ
jgi:tripartite-type tricarboxylate transporter receptor subunit TctC